MKKYLALLFSALFLFSCSGAAVKTGMIKIKGSNTMLPLLEKLADEFMDENPGFEIYTEGGGTEVGIRDLLDNKVQISAASRNLEPEETKLMAERFGSVGVSTFIARDAIRVFVNKQNKVSNVNIDELRKIFTGEIKNWKDVGGIDKPILAIVRDDVSGTAAHFKTRILSGQDFSKSVLEKSKVEDIIEDVEENENAIGFSGLGYEWDCKSLSIDNIYPDEENIKNMTYPLSRYLHFYTINQPTGFLKEFIDWVLSPKGQRIIKEFGFVSLYDFSY